MVPCMTVEAIFGRVQCPPAVLAVKKVLRAPIFQNLGNSETVRYAPERQQIKSSDLQETYEFDFSFFVVSRFVPKLREFEKIGARNTCLLYTSPSPRD